MSSDSRLQTPDSRLFAYVCLGSNLGDRAANLLLAVRGMMNAGLNITRLSSVYETEPVDLREQPSFLNMVAEARAPLFSPEQILARLLRIEYALGRRREIARGPRTIDLDLLLYGSQVRSTEFLKLPHPRLDARRFVLTPLAELVPQLQHPTRHRTISELLATTLDEAKVKRWNGRTRRRGDAETRR